MGLTRGQRIYLSRPLASRSTPASRTALSAIARAFPKARLHDAAALYRSNEDWLGRYRREIACSSALVVLPYRSTIGYGVYCELVAAEDHGLPTLLYARGKFWNTWTLSILSHRYDWKRFARVVPRGHPVDPATIDLSKTKRKVLPTGPLGRVIENRMIEYLLVLSEGRLIVYRPESDFSGTDLQVSLLHSEGVVKIQVKGRTSRAEDRHVAVQVRAAEIPASDPKYILFLEYDLKRAEPREYVWFVPSEAYRAESNLAKGYYKAMLGTTATTKDKWVKYRHNTKDVARVVEGLLRRPKA